MTTVIEANEGQVVLSQQEFHAAVRERGEDAALALLVRSKPNAFGRNEAKRRVRQLVSILRQRGEAEKKAQAAEQRAQLYKQFRDLSLRQRTKRGGFAGFVRQMLGAGWDTAHPILRADLERYEEFESTDGGSYVRTGRLNYRRFANEARTAAETLKTRSELYAKLSILAVA